MFVLSCGVTSIVSFKWLKEIEDLIVSFWTGLLKDILSNSGDEEMTLSPPSLGGSDD